MRSQNSGRSVKVEQPYKIHARIGEHEFDGEGPVENVKHDYGQFLEIIANRGYKDAPRTEHMRMGNGPDAKDETEVEQEILAQIFKSDDARGIVSLRSQPPGENGHRAADAALLLIFGYNKLQSMIEVPVTKLLEGLRESGLSVERFDRTIGIHSGLYLKGGQKIGARYRLTNPGTLKAAQMVRTMLG